MAKKQQPKPIVDLTKGRIAPQATDVEQAVLCAVLISPSALKKVSGFLTPDIFYLTSHQVIYKAILQINEVYGAIDLITVTQKLRENGDLEAAGGAFYITELTSKVYSDMHLKSHALILVQKYMQRRAIEAGIRLKETAYEDTEDVFDLVFSAQTELHDILKVADKGAKRTKSQHLDEMTKDTEAASQGKATGVPIPWAPVAKLLTGWQKQDLIVVAARPGMGKSAFVGQAASHAAENGHPVLFFSLEMAAKQIYMRTIAQTGKLKQEELRRGGGYDLPADIFWELYNEGLGWLTKIPLEVDDSPAVTLQQIQSRSLEFVESHRGKECLIVIDYLQLMTLPEADRRDLSIGIITQGLKTMCKQLDVPVILLSQLNRKVEERTGKRPIMADLKESGDIEQDADVIIFLYRGDYYIADKKEHDGKAEIIVAKHRNGDLDTLVLGWEGKHVRFLEEGSHEFVRAKQDTNTDVKNYWDKIDRRIK